MIANMNNWLLFSILAPLFWGLTNPLDGGLRRYFITDDYGFMWFTMAMRWVFALIACFFLPLHFVFGVAFWGMVLAGLLWVLPFVFYFKALALEDSSRVSILLQMLPLCVLILAFILLGETLDVREFLGFLLILGGGIMAAFKHSEGKWSFSKAFWLTLLATFLWSLSDVLFKYFRPDFVNFSSAFFIYFVGGGLPILLLLFLPGERKKMTKYIRAMPLRAWLMLLISLLAGVSGTLLFTQALLIGDAALTAVFVGLQPLFAFLFALIISRLIKEVPAEDLSGINLILKAGALLVIFIGLIYLNF